MAEFQEVMRCKLRMCREAVRCEECPMYKALRDNTAMLLPRERCHAFIGRYPRKAEEIIMAWAAEHPEKTMKDVLFEKFPNAPRNKGGTPLFCVKELGFPGSKDCARPCEECWNSPAPEE